MFGGHLGHDHELIELIEILILGELSRGSENCCIRLPEGRPWAV